MPPVMACKEDVWEGERRQLDQRVQELEDQMRRDQETANSQLRRNRENAAAELKELETRLQEELCCTQRSLEDANTSGAAMQHELQSTREALMTARDTITSLETRLRAVDQDNTVEQVIEDLLQRLSDANGNETRLGQQLSHLQETAKQQEDQLCQAGERNHALDSQLAQLHGKHSALLQSTSVMQMEYKVCISDMEEERKRCDEEATKRTHLIETLQQTEAQARSELAQTTLCLKEAKVKADHFEDRAAILTKTTNFMGTNISNRCQDIQRGNEKIRELEDEIQQKTESLDLALVEKEQLSKQLQQRDACVNEQAVRILEFEFRENENIALQAIIKERNEAIVELQEEKSRLQQDWDEIANRDHANIAELEHDNGYLGAQASEMQNELDLKNEQIERVDARLKTQDHQIQGLQKENARLQEAAAEPCKDCMETLQFLHGGGSGQDAQAAPSVEPQQAPWLAEFDAEFDICSPGLRALLDQADQTHGPEEALLDAQIDYALQHDDL